MVAIFRLFQKYFLIEMEIVQEMLQLKKDAISRTTGALARPIRAHIKYIQRDI